MSDRRFEIEIPAHHWAQWMVSQFRKANNLAEGDVLIGEPVIPSDISLFAEPLGGVEELGKLGLALLRANQQQVINGHMDAVAYYIVMSEFTLLFED